jgi:glycosyltransferase involved in cell wall biosynthesis
VTLVPQVRPLRNVLAGADIFLQTQPVSPTDATLLDALSVGTAVAVCRRGAEGVLTENENAVFFQPNDELSIYTALRKLLVDRAFARRLAEAGQQYIRSHHSVSRMVEELIEIYQMAQHWYAKTAASAADALSATSAPA